MSTDQEIATKTLIAARGGDQAAADQLLKLVYGELRSRAGALLQRERPDHTLQPTALVHEAYVRLVNSGTIDWAGRTHFFAVAAQTMRRILVDHARSRRAAKREPGQGPAWKVETLHGVSPREAVDSDALGDALEELSELDERAARVVELRFLGGLTEAETASVLGVSERTARSEWAWARSWLRMRLGGE